ncbi:ATP-binding protein [Streptomyces broussonetiae]|uniref:ATP-binding protein n=1 Tax=Streptomyces broussonetiae TaxID=2686304 RepID=A0ABV5EJX0_9ACTN
MAELRSVQVRYRRYRPAVPVARARARELAREWGLLQVADTLEWGVTELVTNAVIHGRAPRGSRVVVAYHLADDLLRVEVRDWASGMPRLIPLASPNGVVRESGRGLATVAALTDRWGVIPRVIGKSVWFEVALTSQATTAPDDEGAQ